MVGQPNTRRLSMCLRKSGLSPKPGWSMNWFVLREILGEQEQESLGWIFILTENRLPLALGMAMSGRSRGSTLLANLMVRCRWHRIATGLFQPLGILVDKERLLVTCRDQIVSLGDNNGDGEMDDYRCLNSDHQVTEHFHEFAMGLQRDGEGNLYYAKSARHALKAVVPHHGTLLRVAADGSKTDIIATGFRAANGVCLNDDGSFIVTDQEGHWNPKNRINWVRPGGFYGNMYGYHDVTDSSDEAMQQPLCWITNAFDRSPAELLWADTESWGPLNGQLLNLSYGYGRIYVVPHEHLSTPSGERQPQGGMCQLPIPDPANRNDSRAVFTDRRAALPRRHVLMGR